MEDIMPARFWSVFFIALTAAVYSEEVSSDADLKAQSQKLGSDSFEERTQAEEALRKAGDKAQPVLETIQNSSDYETKTRAQVLLKQIYGRQKRAKDWNILATDLGPLFGCKDYSFQLPIRKHAPGDPPENDTDSSLRWLSNNQEADGHWDSVKHGAQVNADIEQTSLALLAFLGAGHTEKVGEFKGTVKRAVEWLTAHVSEEGAVLYEGEKEPRGTAQALAGIALCEASGMANIPATNETAQKVTDYSCNTFQSIKDKERFGFGSTLRSESNLLLTTLFTMHLKSSKVAGRKVNPEAWDGMIRLLDAVEHKAKPVAGQADGASEYSFVVGGKTSPRATMMALLARQFMGWKREDLFATAQNAAFDYGNSGEASSDDFTNYLGVLVMFQQGAPLWQAFNDGVRQSALETQRTDGPEAGSWDPRGEWSGAGRVFSTSVRTLGLEVYYRYQQLGQ
jgi:hypothetical protein